MEKYVLKNPDSFKLEHIFECGQCFRWNKIDEKTYVGIVKNSVIKVKQNKKDFIFTGSFFNKLQDSDDSFERLINYYFDLDTDYSLYKKKLSQIDNFLSQSIEFGEGIRILNQDLWEIIISFIISANNNIPRIKGIIET